MINFTINFSLKGGDSMKYEEPEIVKVVVEREKDSAMGPDCCSVAYSSCCYKD
jgi:hypothetical protein